MSGARLALSKDCRDGDTRKELRPGLTVAVAGEQLWVVDGETLRAIDLETHQVGKSLWLGYVPRDMVFDGERLWITSGGQWMDYVYICAGD